MAKRHSIQARVRAFRIWQELGYNPWSRPKREKKKGGDFYKGAFDSIPFLNDDAKRTFAHLLLRPGYMMRDYIRGAHESYLSPLTALIVFFSFFALMSALINPISSEKRELPFKNIEIEEVTGDAGKSLLRKTEEIANTGYLYLNLDQYPEKVTTRRQASLAALESTLRSQGFTLFLGRLLLLWLALGMALKKYHVNLAGCAAVASYFLCQLSFVMLFLLLYTWGERTSVGGLISLALMTLDLRQLLGISWRKSLRRAILVGVYGFLLYLLVLLLISAVILGLAYLKV